MKRICILMGSVFLSLIWQFHYSSHLMHYCTCSIDLSQILIESVSLYSSDWKGLVTILCPLLSLDYMLSYFNQLSWNTKLACCVMISKGSSLPYYLRHWKLDYLEWVTVGSHLPWCSCYVYKLFSWTVVNCAASFSFVVCFNYNISWTHNTTFATFAHAVDAHHFEVEKDVK